MILKKSQRSDEENPAVDLSPQPGFRIGKKTATSPEDEAAASRQGEESEDTPPCDDSTEPISLESAPPAEAAGKQKIRLSADIDRQAYVALKCFATIHGIPLVSVLNELIYKNCSIKVSI